MRRIFSKKKKRLITLGEKIKEKSITSQLKEEEDV
jgi:hypothetical protein